MKKSQHLLQISFLILFLFEAAACSSISSNISNPIPASQVENASPKDASASPVNEQETRKKIARFEDVLRTRGSRLTSADWKLHDELLATYIKLKQGVHGTKINIPAHSHLTVDLRSFCLNSSKSSPSAGDKFHWIQGDPGIPYFKKILSLTSSNQLDQGRAQTLLWNLSNKTDWDDYPRDLQAVLLKIDPEAPLKLPSSVAREVENAAVDYFKSQIPLVDSMSDAKDLIAEKFQSYRDFADSIPRSSSNTSDQENQDLEEIPDTHLYADVQSDGYGSQKVSFYNPSNQTQQIDLSDYYLQPAHKNVQRIGLAGRHDSPISLNAALESALFGSMARVGIGFVPVIGEVADTYELLCGRDFLTGAKLTTGERILSGLGMLAGGTAGFRFAERAAFAPEEFIPRFEAGFEKVAKREIALSENQLKQSRELVTEAQETERAVRASPTLRAAIENPAFKKTDFYIRPNGEVLPSKGFRYIPSEATYLDEVTKTGVLPARESTYISFNDFASSEAASSRLQIKHDGAIKLEFDTKQILDDIKVPNGEWGKASWLEPLTKDYPKLGAGGATQAITHHEIRASRITDLRNGKVLYESK